jgi:hypothetical protein
MYLVYFVRGVWQYCDRITSVVGAFIANTSASGQRRTHQGIDLVIKESVSPLLYTHYIFNIVLVCNRDNFG